MAEKRAANEDREAELRVKLVKRLAVAGVMVAVLLAVLAFFDHLAKPEEPEAPVFTKPVPVPPKKEMTQPVKPNAELPDPPNPEPKPAEPAPAVTPETPPKPEVSAAPAVPANPVPEAVRPTLKAAPVRPAAQPGKPAAEPLKATPVAPVAEGTAVPGSKPVAVAPVAKPPETTPSMATPVAPVRPNTTPVMATPTLPRLLSGYVVQAGVFSNAQAAEELHAKLALNGIPSSLEAKVSVGPFKTREEALAAQEKMKALGIDALMIPPASRK